MFLLLGTWVEAVWELCWPGVPGKAWVQLVQVCVGGCFCLEISPVARTLF